DLAAEAAADARFNDSCHGVGAERIGRRLYRQRGATGQPDAGVIAGADLIVHAIARARHPLAALELFGVLGADTTLAGELAFAIGDDHFQPALGRLHRLLERIHHHADALGAHRAQPLYAPRTKGLFDTHPRRRAAAAHRARWNVLLAGRGGVAVLHDDQHAVAFVEQVRRHTGDQPVMPEAAIAHDRNRTAFHVRRNRRRARERHAVAQD